MPETRKVLTTKGVLDESVLARTLGFEDRPTEYVIWVAWLLDGELVRREHYALPKTTSDPIYTAVGDQPACQLERTIELQDLPTEVVLVEVYRLGGHVVKRSPNVILKSSVTADAVAASLE